jgi:hypothetical protein
MAADGGALAVDWNRSPTPGVWTISLRSATQQLLMERGMRGTVRPIGWAADGRAVYVRRYKPDDIALVPVAGAPPRQTFPVPVENGECSVRDSRAGTAIACVSTQSVSDAWMIEGYDRR